MAKKQKLENSKEFTIQDAHRHVARGMHSFLGAVDDALKEECPICDEVWEYIVTTFWGNPRAQSMVRQHAPAFVRA